MTVATNHQYSPSSHPAAPPATHTSFSIPHNGLKPRNMPSIVPNGPYLHTYNAKPPSPPPIFDQDSNETDDEPMEDEETNLHTPNLPQTLGKPLSFLDSLSKNAVYSSSPAMSSAGTGSTVFEGSSAGFSQLSKSSQFSESSQLGVNSELDQNSQPTGDGLKLHLVGLASINSPESSTCSSANTSSASTNASSANTSSNLDYLESMSPKYPKCECGVHKGSIPTPHTCKSHRVNLDLLLEASEAFAKAERESRSRVYPDSHTQVLLDRATQLAQADRYITAAINRVQSSPQASRSEELRPIDRREQTLPSHWTRFSAIMADPFMETECQRVVRGMQGCGRDCSAKFTNLVEFAQHMDEHHHLGFRPYCCPAKHCPWGVIGFHERSECTRHIRTKHYKAMYVCEFEGCNKVYNRSDAFRRHIRHSHSAAASKVSNAPEEEGRHYYYSRRY